MNKKYSILFYGLLFILLGWCLRAIDTVELTTQATGVIAKYTHPEPTATAWWAASQATTSAQRTIEVPSWIGWSFLCGGGVLVLESLIVPKG